MKTILLVGLGGGIGSILRYLIGLFIGRYFPSTFPLATFIINLIGCFLIGILFGIFNKNSPDTNLSLLLIVGFCGGFTTFSAFSLENLSLFQSGNYLIALIYILSSLSLGILASFVGLLLSK